MLENAKEFHEDEEDNRNRGKIYEYYAKKDENNHITNMYFISQDDNFVSCELNQAIDSYLWINDTYFIFSKEGKGIFYYDLSNQRKGILIEGNDEFQLKEYDGQVLTYDDTQVNL